MPNLSLDNAKGLLNILLAMTPAINRDFEPARSREFTSDTLRLNLTIVHEGVMVDSGDEVLGIVPNSEVMLHKQFVNLVQSRTSKLNPIDEVISGSFSNNPIMLDMVDFYQLFTAAENSDIFKLKDTDDIVGGAMRTLGLAETVNLSKASVIGMIAYLKTVERPGNAPDKVITDAREIRILSGQEPV